VIKIHERNQRLFRLHRCWLFFSFFFSLLSRRTFGLKRKLWLLWNLEKLSIGFISTLRPVIHFEIVSILLQLSNLALVSLPIPLRHLCIDTFIVGAHRGPFLTAHAHQVLVGQLLLLGLLVAAPLVTEEDVA
jgi:hypothetical protein